MHFTIHYDKHSSINCIFITTFQIIHLYQPIILVTYDIFSQTQLNILLQRDIKLLTHNTIVLLLVSHAKSALR